MIHSLFGSWQTGIIEAWGRSENNPVKGWHVLKKGLRGRVGMHIPPLRVCLGLAEVIHDPKGNKMKAKYQSWYQRCGLITGTLL